MYYLTLPMLYEVPHYIRLLVKFDSTFFLFQDKLGWNPVMAATKADSGGEELVEMFLVFLESRCQCYKLL